jgi:hypothetical protein
MVLIMKSAICGIDYKRRAIRVMAKSREGPLQIIARCRWQASLRDANRGAFAIRGMNAPATFVPSLRDENLGGHSVCVAERRLPVAGRFNARSSDQPARASRSDACR